MPDPTTDAPSSASRGPEPSPDGSGWRYGLLLVVATMALAIAIASWVVDRGQMDRLQHDVAALQDAHQRLAIEVMGGRPVGRGSAGQTIDVARAPALGRPDAVVTLIEFSDYECPFCIRHFQQTLPVIEKNYIQSGKIRYVFRDFPIDANHPEAIKAHEAARCALEQNKFWELHTRLFSPPGSHTASGLEDRAKEARLDLTAFRACVASGRTGPSIRASASTANSFGATGTPWFFVGLRDLKTDQVRVLKIIGGAQPYEQFVSALDAAIKQSGTP